jgi:hypothetical protein
MLQWLGFFVLFVRAKSLGFFQHALCGGSVLGRMIYVVFLGFVASRCSFKPTHRQFLCRLKYLAGMFEI